MPSPDVPLVKPPTLHDGVPIGALRCYPRWLQVRAVEGRISARAVLLWAEIASLQRHGRRGVADPSLRYLAEQIPPRKGRPVSERTVERYIAQLESVGAVTVVRRQGLRNEYIPHLEPRPEALPLFPDGGPGGEVGTERRAPLPGSTPGIRRTPAGTPETGVGGPPTHTPETGVGRSRGKHESEASAGTPGAPRGENGGDPLAGALATAALAPALDDPEALGAAGLHDAAAEAMERALSRQARDLQAKRGEDQAPAVPKPPGRPAPPWVALLVGAAGDLDRVPADHLAAELRAELARRAPTPADTARRIREFAAGASAASVAGLVAAVNGFPLRRIAAASVIERGAPAQVRNRVRYLIAAVDGCARDIEREIGKTVDRRLDERRPVAGRG